MKKFLAFGLLLAFATPAAAQWTTELGINGVGFTRLKPTGTSAEDHVDFINLPGWSFAPALWGPAPVYVIIPWRDKIALEPSLAVSQLSIGGGSASLVNVGLRANYAFSPKIYGALGGALGFVESGGSSETQLALQAALGYRLTLPYGLNGRLEAHVLTAAKTETVDPQNAYSVMLGVSVPVSRAAARTRAPARGAAARSWQRALGVAAGYTYVRPVGDDGETILSFPGWGAAYPLASPTVAPTPSTIFAIFPLGQNTALEGGIDFHRIQSGGNTAFSGVLSARLDYALNNRWYGAAGGVLSYVETSGLDASSVFGGQVALGYRFPLTAGLGGRLEANYTMFPTNDSRLADYGTGAVNIFGLTFGVTMPLR